MHFPSPFCDVSEATVPPSIANRFELIACVVSDSNDRGLRLLFVVPSATAKLGQRDAVIAHMDMTKIIHRLLIAPPFSQQIWRIMRKANSSQEASRTANERKHVLRFALREI